MNAMRDDIQFDLDHEVFVGARIGSGGMADVHSVFLNGRELALKVLREKSEKCRRLFNNEIDVLRACRGPGVLDMIMPGKYRGMPAFLCERHPYTLYDLGRDMPLSSAAVVPYALDVLDALKRVHTLGVVHRDIKPANILVSQFSKAILCDFSVAWLKDRPEVCGGTPSFGPPEPASAAELPHRDTYSLAATMFSLMTHKRTLQLRDPVIRPHVVLRLHPSLRSVILKATELDPQSRYQTAEAMSDDLLQAYNKEHEDRVNERYQ